MTTTQKFHGGDVIYRELLAEQATGETVYLAHPARPDLRHLTCSVCGAPASPHRSGHDVVVMIPARVRASEG